MIATFLVLPIAAALLVGLELLAGPRRDLVWLAGVSLGAALVAIVVMLAASAAASRSAGLTVAGMAAAVAALGGVRLLARR